MWKSRIIALVCLVSGLAVGYFVFVSENSTARWLNFPFRLGLDLSGGTHLVYEAETGNLSDSDIPDAMSALRGVIERRVNMFGVSEPIVQVEGLGLSSKPRLIVELPGVTDISSAIKLIDKTPNLEFKTEDPNAVSTSTTPNYLATGLTGRYLKRAQVVFNSNSINPSVSLEFNSDGAKLFEQITSANVGKRVAIYLDGIPISEPVVNEPIRDGRAEISGNFSPEEAKTLSRDLNLGALPVPIKLISTQTIGATLGEDAVSKGARAAFWGFVAIAVFLIVWYRLPGVIAVLALSIYVSIVLALFKLIPVTLTSAGIAGFILSMGLAVDANVLIFERIKEELRSGRELKDSLEEGFRRAWLSIRDSNVSSLITSIILFWFGESLIEGFALTFALGVLVSMFSAIIITRIFLRASGFSRTTKLTKILFQSGFDF